MNQESMRNIIRAGLHDSASVKEAIASDCQRIDTLLLAATIVAEAVRTGGKILFCGNGGSAADAQHLATELVVRLTGDFERPAIAAIALTTDTSILDGVAPTIMATTTSLSGKSKLWARKATS